MRRRIGMLFVLAAALTLAGCVPATPGSPDLQPPLKDTSWTLESMGQPGSLRPVLDGTEVTLAFSDDSNATGTAGCNGYGGSYTSDRDGSLTFTDLFHTEMYCMQPGVMDQEQDFLDGLAAAAHYEVVDGKLHISGGGQLLVLTPA